MAKISHLSEEYLTYISSPAWQAKRLVALELADYRCQICNSPSRLDVHHRTYERFGDEARADLTVLCRGCHDLYHGPPKRQPPRAKKRRKPKAATKPRAPVEKKPTKATKRARELGLENQRLHAAQQNNKRKQQLVREGIVSPSLRADLVQRIESA